MTLNGKINENGKIRTPIQSFWIESAGSLGIAEAASMVTSLGVVGVADVLAPNLVKQTSKALSKAVFEPYLDYVEGFMNRICKLEECKPDKTLPREVRAEKLAHATVLFIPAFLASLGVKIATRRAMINGLGLPDDASGAKWWEVWKLARSEQIIIGMDEGVHLGSLLLLNTKAAGITDEMIRSTNSILQKVGISKDKAKDLSNMVMIWELPNALGLAAGSVGVYGKHLKPKWWRLLAGKHADQILTEHHTHSL